MNCWMAEEDVSKGVRKQRWSVDGTEDFTKEYKGKQI